MNNLTLNGVNWAGYFRRPSTGLSLFTAFCLTLITISYLKSGNITYLFLAWNIFLAWVPLFFAKIWQSRLSSKPLAKWKSLVMFCLWLLFFPNAPYLITDLVHLNHRFNPAFWSDTLLLFSCALCGLIVGLYSVYISQKCLNQLMRNSLSWAIILPSLLLSGFGIYLGRVQRWNSWDLFTKPFQLLSDILKQLGNPQAIGMTLGFSALLFILYFMLVSLTSYEKNKN